MPVSTIDWLNDDEDATPLEGDISSKSLYPKTAPKQGLSWGEAGMAFGGGIAGSIATEGALATAGGALGLASSPITLAILALAGGGIAGAEIDRMIRAGFDPNEDYTLPTGKQLMSEASWGLAGGAASRVVGNIFKHGAQEGIRKSMEPLFAATVDPANAGVRAGFRKGGSLVDKALESGPVEDYLKTHVGATEAFPKGQAKATINDLSRWLEGYIAPPKSLRKSLLVDHHLNPNEEMSEAAIDAQLGDLTTWEKLKNFVGQNISSPKRYIEKVDPTQLTRQNIAQTLANASMGQRGIAGFFQPKIDRLVELVDPGDRAEAFVKALRFRELDPSNLPKDAQAILLRNADAVRAFDELQSEHWLLKTRYLKEGDAELYKAGNTEALQPWEQSPTSNSVPKFRQPLKSSTDFQRWKTKYPDVEDDKLLKMMENSGERARTKGDFGLQEPNVYSQKDLATNFDLMDNNLASLLQRQNLHTATDVSNVITLGGKEVRVKPGWKHIVESSVDPTTGRTINKKVLVPDDTIITDPSNRQLFHHYFVNQQDWGSAQAFNTTYKMLTEKGDDLAGHGPRVISKFLNDAMLQNTWLSSVGETTKQFSYLGRNMGFGDAAAGRLLRKRNPMLDDVLQMFKNAPITEMIEEQGGSHFATPTAALRSTEEWIRTGGADGAISSIYNVAKEAADDLLHGRPFNGALKQRAKEFMKLPLTEAQKAAGKDAGDIAAEHLAKQFSTLNPVTGEMAGINGIRPETWMHALGNAVEQTYYTTGPSDLGPLFKNPIGALLTQFRPFMVKASHHFNDNTMRPIIEGMKTGDASLRNLGLSRLAKVVGYNIPAGIVTTSAKAALRGRYPTPEGITQQVLGNTFGWPGDPVATAFNVGLSGNTPSAGDFFTIPGVSLVTTSAKDVLGSGRDFAKGDYGKGAGKLIRAAGKGLAGLDPRAPYITDFTGNVLLDINNPRRKHTLARDINRDLDRGSLFGFNYNSIFGEDNEGPAPVEDDGAAVDAMVEAEEDDSGIISPGDSRRSMSYKPPSGYRYSTQREGDPFDPRTMSEEEAITRTLIGEAANQPYEGKLALAQSMIHRARDPQKRWPSNLTQVALQPKQYTAWDNPRLRAMMLRAEHVMPEQYAEARQAARDAIQGNTPDLVSGSQDYLNPEQTIKDRGSLPDWTGRAEPTVRIGAHQWYKE